MNHQYKQTAVLAAINSMCAFGISKHVYHTTLTDEQFQNNLKLAHAFNKDMALLRLREAASGRR